MVCHRLVFLCLVSSPGVVADQHGGVQLGKAFAKAAGVGKAVAGAAEAAATSVAEQQDSPEEVLTEVKAAATSAAEQESPKDVLSEVKAGMGKLEESASSAVASASSALGSKAAAVPKSAADCATEAELDAWHDAHLGFVKARLPVEEQEHAHQLLEKAVANRRAELRKSSGVEQARAQPRPAAVPECLLDAMKCNTTRELRAWRRTKLSWIVDHVPEGPARESQVNGVRSDFTKREGALLARKEAEAVGTAASISLESAEAPPAHAGILFATFGLAAVGLATPALLSFLGSVAGALGFGGRGSGEMYDDSQPGYMLCEA